MGFFRRDKEPWNWYWGVPSWEPTGIECLKYYMEADQARHGCRHATHALLTCFLDYSKWKWPKRWSKLHDHSHEPVPGPRRLKKGLMP